MWFWVFSPSVSTTMNFLRLPEPKAAASVKGSLCDSVARPQATPMAMLVLARGRMASTVSVRSRKSLPPWTEVSGRIGAMSPIAFHCDSRTAG